MLEWGKAFWRRMRAPVLGLFFSFLLCSGFLFGIGESPRVLLDAINNTLFTGFGIGYTLFYATPLILTGLSVAVAFHCGLFNIGAEGQLYIGSLGIIGTVAAFPNVSWVIALPLGIFAAAALGGLWGGLAGILKAKRGSHEVIVTILLNFIGVSIVDYAILYTFKNPQVQNPETFEIPSTYTIPLLSDIFEPMGFSILNSTPVSLALFLAIGGAAVCHLLLFHTVWGYEMRTVGQNPTAAKFAGISVTRNTVLAFFVAGSLAGLVGVNEVMGHQHKLVEGFSPQYGFTGIAVALLARNHPLGVILCALLFGALHNSSRELEFLSQKVTKELSLVLQGTLIAFVACDFLFEKFLRGPLPSSSKGREPT